jgi:hypothetical protein
MGEAVLVMRTQMEMKLECLKLAGTLATSKTIKPTEVVAQAKEYFGWLLQLEPSPRDEARRASPAELHQLANHFGVRR